MSSKENSKEGARAVVKGTKIPVVSNTRSAVYVYKYDQKEKDYYPVVITGRGDKAVLSKRDYDWNMANNRHFSNGDIIPISEFVGNTEVIKQTNKLYDQIISGAHNITLTDLDTEVIVRTREKLCGEVEVIKKNMQSLELIDAELRVRTVRK